LAHTFFSESWHRIKDFRVALVPSVSARKQVFRGEEWFLLQDAFAGRYFRLRAEAYRFISRLTSARTLGEVWLESLEQDPDATPGQDDVLRLLTQLHQATLIHVSGHPDSLRLFEQQQQQQQREFRSRLTSILAIRIPLFDPHAILQKCRPLLRLLFRLPVGIALVLGILTGFSALIGQTKALSAQAEGMLSPGNLIWLYISMIILKVLHEFSHAGACVRFGGQVHAMGITLLFFTPYPYLDASSAWVVRSRWQRVVIGAAGMLAELFVAALAAVVWVRSGDGVIHSLAFNVMVIGSLSSLLFNGNPLLRYDAYYILSDLLEFPNLQERCKAQVYWLLQKYLLGVRSEASPSTSRESAVWMTLYGISSLLYRLVISVGIIAFIADQWLLAGVLFGAVMVMTMVVLPLFQGISWLLTSPLLASCRPRAWLVSAGIFGTLVAAVLWLPLPNGVRAPGIVESENLAVVYAPTEGYLTETPVPSGEWVETGRVLAVLSNQDLEFDLVTTRAQIEETLAMDLLAQSKSISDLGPIRERLAVLNAKLTTIEERQHNLLVLAERPGIWIAPDLARRKNTWIRERLQLGRILDPQSLRFTAVVAQEQASSLFVHPDLKGWVKLNGRATSPYEVSRLQVLPCERRELPSAALGWYGGGDIAVSTRQQSGTVAVDAFFEVRVALPSSALGLVKVGHTGVLRVEMPPEPLAQYLQRAIGQLMQKRYRI